MFEEGEKIVGMDGCINQQGDESIMSTHHIVENFNIICVDGVVADYTGYSTGRKAALKNLVFYGKVLSSSCMK